MWPQNGSPCRPLFNDTKLAWVGVTKDPLRVPKVKGQKCQKFSNCKNSPKHCVFWHSFRGIKVFDHEEHDGDISFFI